MSHNVGINIVEVDGKAVPSIQPAPTSVAAFIIRAQRGLPEAVFRITNWTQFTDHFGSYMEGAFGTYAVRGFFDNGGSVAYITRVVNTSPGETAASIISPNNGPWNLRNLDPAGIPLIFDVNIDGTLSTHNVQFNATEAELTGGSGPFDLEDETGNGKFFSLNVNGVDHGPYQFVAADFEDVNAATAAEVAAVLNREFQGIQALVEEGNLKIRTARRGTSASLQVNTVGLGEGEEAADLGFPDGPQTGSGNVTDIDAVTPAEAVSLIDAALPEDLTVTQVGQQVKIEHGETGIDNTIQVVAASTADQIFGFDNDVHSGTAGDPTAAVVSSHNFNDGGTTALIVKAGYRGEEDPGVWGDNIGIRIAPNTEETGIYDLFVRYNGDVVETWEKLNVSGDPEQHPETVINDEFTGSRYITVEVPTGVTNNPATTDGMAEEDTDCFVNLEDGADDTLTGASLTNAVNAALTRFDIYSVQLVCCPESDAREVVRRALTYCQNRGDCMFVGHTPQGYDAGAAKSYGKDFQGKKVYGALYFPWIRVSDPIGTQRWIPPTGHVMGVYARTERERGIWKAPAGNAALVNGALDVEKHITDTDHTDLVKNGSVNAVRFVPGQGIIVDSSRSLSTSPLWLYVNIRLLFNFVKSSLKAGLRWVVQEPNDDTLWNKVQYNSVTPFLMGLWRRGAFGPGAPEDVFTVKCDAENNTPENIQQGIFTVEVYFYPSRPAETIVIIVGQQEAGATASEA